MELSDLAYVDETGFHVADYPTFQQYFTDKYRGIYGQDIYLEPDSQDGQWIAVQAKAAFDTAMRDQATYNSYPPSGAQGIGLARQVKLNGVQKKIATNSTADLTVVGQAGTVITNGIAQDTVSQKWNLPASVTIPGGGTIVVTATAQDVGAVQASANTINQIYTPTLGWQTVNNVAAATAGNPVESDAALRIRQAQSVADPSLTVFEGTIGGVENLPGVIQVRGYENDTESTDANGLPAHSISVMVLGGDVDDIAQEIQIHKTPGTTTDGTTSVTVVDSKGMPLIIKFTRPTIATVQCQLTLSVLPGWSTDYESQIAASVAAVIDAFGIGNNVLYTRLFSPAYLPGVPGTTYNVVGIELGKNGGGLSAANVTIDFDEYPDCDPTVDVTFVIT